jgi:uncharacterized protein YndB with AHSA1/START domain
MEEARGMNLSGSINRVVLMVLAAVLLGGCGAARSAPPTPITNMSQIEGKWRGTITEGFSGPEQLYYLTIRPDGSLVAQWGMNWQWGNVTLSGGAASFNMSGGVAGTSSGTLTYSAGPGQRSLTLNSTFGNWSANVTPLE